MHRLLNRVRYEGVNGHRLLYASSPSAPFIATLQIPRTDFEFYDCCFLLIYWAVLDGEFLL